MIFPTDEAGITRRSMLGRSVSAGLGAGIGLAGLGGCATVSGSALAAPSGFGAGAILPLRASASRIFDITVCLRPFRAAGPRLDTETIGNTLVVHNYGHGGSGWSLSWGSGAIAVAKAMANSPKEIAVIGCGGLGLTAATLAQRAGAKVTIYAKDFFPATRSARATGSWTPDSRIAQTSVDAAFGDVWEQMARTSFKAFRSYLGLPGDPVEFTDRYSLSDHEMTFPRPRKVLEPGEPDFATYASRIRDINGRAELMPAGSTPFASPFVYRNESLQFNIADYAHTLLMDFLAAGGKIQRMEFHTPGDLTKLPEKVVINCPGYGARAWWQDESIIPVRGQIAWLIPQAEVRYGLNYKNVNMLARRDGVVIQANDGGEAQGWKDENETIDRADGERGVNVIAEAYAGFGTKRALLELSGDARVAGRSGRRQNR